MGFGEAHGFHAFSGHVPDPVPGQNACFLGGTAGGHLLHDNAAVLQFRENADADAHISIIPGADVVLVGGFVEIVAPPVPQGLDHGIGGGVLHLLHIYVLNADVPLFNDAFQPPQFRLRTEVQKDEQHGERHQRT